jgi:hypothetical protein
MKKSRNFACILGIESYYHMMSLLTADTKSKEGKQLLETFPEVVAEEQQIIPQKLLDAIREHDKERFIFALGQQDYKAVTLKYSVEGHVGKHFYKLSEIGSELSVYELQTIGKFMADKIEWTVVWKKQCHPYPDSNAAKINYVFHCIATKHIERIW